MYRSPSCTGDHPRACGENGADLDDGAVADGSSPRVRGKLGAVDARLHTLGIIPARAGKTPRAAWRPRRGWDHPRACGENRGPALYGLPHYGSSPRVRGKRHLGPRNRRPPRIIPARAGKTRLRPMGRLSSWDHPRACGENLAYNKCEWFRNGSSPRVRGKPAAGVFAGSGMGIIPARAGKTPREVIRIPPPSDHPRACGENKDLLFGSEDDPGSSPRVRGKRARVGQGQDRDRIIPARAGKTDEVNEVNVVIRDHPRACGENIECRPECAPDDGSSPRVRGKPPPGLAGRTRCGIIPARAGKTRRRRHSSRGIPDHPRACGENRRPVRRDLRHGRIIPARAGKTRVSHLVWFHTRDHPRACGENHVSVRVVLGYPGSSPRVRGKRWWCSCS